MRGIGKWIMHGWPISPPTTRSNHSNYLVPASLGKEMTLSAEQSALLFLSLSDRVRERASEIGIYKTARIPPNTHYRNAASDGPIIWSACSSAASSPALHCTAPCIRPVHLARQGERVGHLLLATTSHSEATASQPAICPPVPVPAAGRDGRRPEPWGGAGPSAGRVQLRP